MIVSHGIYFHGEIEEKAGFDIPIFLEGDFNSDMEEGIHECLVILPGEEVTCTLYTWRPEGVRKISTKDGEKDYLSIKGYIIIPESKFKEEVEECYSNKERFL